MKYQLINHAKVNSLVRLSISRNKLRFIVYDCTTVFFVITCYLLTLCSIQTSTFISFFSAFFFPYCLSFFCFFPFPSTLLCFRSERTLSPSLRSESDSNNMETVSSVAFPSNTCDALTNTATLFSFTFLSS